MINRCLFSYLNMFSEKKESIVNNFLQNNSEYEESQLVLDKPLPFTNGKLADVEYFYSFFEIEDLNKIIDEFKPKIFLVIDKTLGGEEIKIGDLVIVRLVYTPISA